MSSQSVRPIEILTGGNPRLIGVIAQFGATQSFHNLMNNLYSLVDDHTDYFKSHLESLPSQERRVYLALARLMETRDPLEKSRSARAPRYQQMQRASEASHRTGSGGDGGGEHPDADNTI